MANSCTNCGKRLPFLEELDGDAVCGEAKTTGKRAAAVCEERCKNEYFFSAKNRDRALESFELCFSFFLGDGAVNRNVEGHESGLSAHQGFGDRGTIANSIRIQI